jgi:hypothetical protein
MVYKIHNIFIICYVQECTEWKNLKHEHTVAFPLWKLLREYGATLRYKYDAYILTVAYIWNVLSCLCEINDKY